MRSNFFRSYIHLRCNEKKILSLALYRKSIGRCTVRRTTICLYAFIEFVNSRKIFIRSKNALIRTIIIANAYNLEPLHPNSYILPTILARKMFQNWHELRVYFLAHPSAYVMISRYWISNNNPISLSIPYQKKTWCSTIRPLLERKIKIKEIHVT